MSEKEGKNNVYQGAPDARQSEDANLPLSRFRPRYRALSDDELFLHDKIKDAYTAVEQLIEQLPAGRYTSLALTSLESSCMWAVKALTDNK